MYKCHCCKLETKQLNGLMTRYYKTHCTETYPKNQYKQDILEHNGRKLNDCLVCNLPVPIPKGEKDSPTMHKDCFLYEYIMGIKNPNWRGGKIIVNCKNCQIEIEKHKSQFQQDNRFCSISCSMNFYAKEENKTDAQKQAPELARKTRQKRYGKFQSAENKRLGFALRTRLINALKGRYKAGSAVRDLGCTIDELKLHLESLFQPGMSWDNWGLYGWHIDHILPLSKFDLTNRDELLKAVHYTNLQPLWAKDNIRKSNN